MTLLDVYVVSCPPPPLLSLFLIQELVSDALTCFRQGCNWDGKRWNGRCVHRGRVDGNAFQTTRSGASHPCWSVLFPLLLHFALFESKKVMAYSRFFWAWARDQCLLPCC